MKVRKDKAGSDSYGNTWEHDGDVVEVPDEQGLDLVSIVDGGFTAVEPDDDSAAPEDDDSDDHAQKDAQEEQSAEERAVDEAPHPPARRGGRARKDTVEE